MADTPTAPPALTHDDTDDEPDIPVVDHVAEGPEKSLQAVADASAARGEDIRMRVVIHLWNPPPVRQYVGWRGQIWKFAVKTVDEARLAQQSVELFFDILGMVGVDRLRRELIKVKARLVTAASEGK